MKVFDFNADEQRAWIWQWDSNPSRYQRFQLIPTGPPPPPRPDPDGWPQQRNSRHRGLHSTGCLFYVACWLGGLNGQGEFDDAFDWAHGNGFAAGDGELKVGTQSLADRIASKYGRGRRGGTVCHGCNHYWVEEGGRETYNSWIGQH
jgi:hypothetical protein